MSEVKGWDPVWEKIFREQDWGKYPPEHVIRFVARHFYSAPDRRVVKLLDLGCGTGACSWFMAKEGFDVYGIDGSETAIRRAGEWFDREGLSGTFQTGDFVRLPWPDNTFDGVVENVALCCNPFSRCQAVVAEVLRVLKPGGKFTTCTFTDATWGHESARRVGNNEYEDFTEGPFLDRGFALLMDRGQLDQLLAGFDAVSIERAARTVGGMKYLIEWWTAEGTKPGAV